MSEPGSNRVDIHPGSEQMSCGGVPDRVRANSFFCQGWHALSRKLNVPFHQGIETKPGHRVAIAVDEYRAPFGTSGNQRFEFLHGLLPERAKTYLSPLAIESH